MIVILNPQGFRDVLRRYSDKSYESVTYLKQSQLEFASFKKLKALELRKNFKLYIFLSESLFKLCMSMESIIRETTLKETKE